jgi:hypothetical protein
MIPTHHIVSLWLTLRWTEALRCIRANRAAYRAMRLRPF